MSNDATHKNILAIKQHSEETRKLVRELENRLNAINSLNLKVLELEKQIQVLQVKLFSGGSTSGS